MNTSKPLRLLASQSLHPNFFSFKHGTLYSTVWCDRLTYTDITNVELLLCRLYASIINVAYCVFNVHLVNTVVIATCIRSLLRTAVDCSPVTK